MLFEEYFKKTIINLYGKNSNVYKAYKLVVTEMCKEKGFIRKFSGEDYYIHCISVAFNLIALNILDEDIISAALLHDILEDIEKYDYNMLCNLFNERIANLVLLVSKDKSVDYHIENNFKEYVNRSFSCWDSAIIKASDRLHNMQTLTGSSKKYMLRKANETEKYFMPLIEKYGITCPKIEYQKLFFLSLNLISQEITYIRKICK